MNCRSGEKTAKQHRELSRSWGVGEGGGRKEEEYEEQSDGERMIMSKRQRVGKGIQQLTY